MKVAVRHDAVTDTVARLALTVRQFEDQLDALDAEAARLRSSWSGEAQAAYARAHLDWGTAIRGMKAALAEANRRLITANAISMEPPALPQRSGDSVADAVDGVVARSIGDRDRAAMHRGARGGGYSFEGSGSPLASVDVFA